MTVAAALLALNYETVLKAYEGCPVPFIYGPSQTGKTHSCKTALALLGMLQRGFFKKITSQYIIINVIDDPCDIKHRKGNHTVPSDLVNDIFDGAWLPF